MAANTELTQQEIKKNIEQATRNLEEEKHLFEALLEHLPTGVIVTNSEGHLLLYNHQAQQLLEEKMERNPDWVVTSSKFLNLPMQSRSFKRCGFSQTSQMGFLNVVFSWEGTEGP